jgi:hypothetical protein
MAPAPVSCQSWLRPIGEYFGIADDLLTNGTGSISRFG